MNEIRKNYQFYIICVLFFIWMTYFSYRSLWLNDDIIYGFHFETGKPILSFSDVITSQITHYFTVNGRFIAHFFVQLCIPFLGHALFSVVNAGVCVLFLLLVMHVTNIKKDEWMYVFAIASLILFGFQTKFVPTCLIGYFWMFAIVLGFIILFFEYGKKHFSILTNILLALYSIVAGWTNESLVAGVSVALIIFVCHNFRNITKSQWIMFFMFGVGALLLCFSPATLSRTNAEKANVDFLSPGLYSIVKLLFYSRCSYILLLYLGYLKLYRKVPLTLLYRQEPFIIHTYLTLLAMNLVVGVFGNRQLFGMELCSIILLARYFKTYNNLRDLKYISILLFVWLVYKTAFNINFLNRINGRYTHIVNEYIKSDDGVVYYDLSRNDVIFDETYPSSVFTIHVFKALRLKFKELYPSKPSLLVLPTICKNLDSNNNLKSKIVNNACDSHSILISKDNKISKITQKRKIRIMGFNFPFVDRDLTFISPIYENETHKVLQIYDKIPFLKNDTIIIE